MAKKKNTYDRAVDSIVKEALEAGPFDGSEGDLVEEYIRKAADKAYHYGFEDGQDEPIANIDPTA